MEMDDSPGLAACLDPSRIDENKLLGWADVPPTYSSIFDIDRDRGGKRSRHPRQVTLDERLH